MKNTYLLLIGGLICASCSREEAIPGPEANYSRTVAYRYQPSVMQRDTAYQSPALRAEARLTAASCTIQLQLGTGEEGLALSVPRGQMPASLVGRYALRAPVNPGQAPSFNYSVRMPDKSPGSNAWSYFSWWLPSTGAVTGAVEITAYDAKRQLLSGHFRLALTGVHDPLALSSEFSTRRCDLTLAGTFANVTVATVE